MQPFSGNEAKISSIIPEGKTETLFDEFVNEYKYEFKNEIKNILKTIYQIGYTTGARSSFFKQPEGKFGDFICAIFDVPEKNLRVYCIRLGMDAIIPDGGGKKAAGVIARQEDEKLTKEAIQMIEIAKDILKRLDEGDLYWSDDRTEIEGHLKNFDNE